MMIHKLYNSVLFRLIIISVFSLSIAGLIIYFSFSEPFWDTLRKFDYRFLFPGILMICLSWVLDGIRLRNLARATNTVIGLWNCIRIQLITEFTTAVTPSGMGGGPVKIYLVQKQGTSFGNSTTIFSVDKFVDMMFFIISLPVYLYIISVLHLTSPENISLHTGIVLSICLLSCILLVLAFIYRFMKSGTGNYGHIQRLIQSRWVRWIIPSKYRSYFEEQTHNFLHQIKNDLSHLINYKKSVLVYNFILSATKWNLRYGVLPFMLAYGFNLNINFFVFFLIQELLCFGSFFIMTPGGSGGVEVAYSVVSAPFIPLNLIGITLLIWRFYTFYLNVIAGGITVVISMGKEGIAKLLELSPLKPGDQSPQ